MNLNIYTQYRFVQSVSWRPQTAGQKECFDAGSSVFVTWGVVQWIRPCILKIQSPLLEDNFVKIIPK